MKEEVEGGRAWNFLINSRHGGERRFRDQSFWNYLFIFLYPANNLRNQPRDIVFVSCTEIDNKKTLSMKRKSNLLWENYDLQQLIILFFFFMRKCVVCCDLITFVLYVVLLHLTVIRVCYVIYFVIWEHNQGL